MTQSEKKLLAGLAGGTIGYFLNTESGKTAVTAAIEVLSDD